ncbi:hypothetical protein ACHAWC_009207, partial [Mediolabrus comicus]
MPRRKNAAAESSAGYKKSELQSLISSSTNGNSEQSSLVGSAFSHRRRRSLDQYHRRSSLESINKKDDDDDDVTIMTTLTSSTSITATPIIAAITKHTGLPRKAAYIVLSLIFILFITYKEGYRIRVNVSSSNLSSIFTVDDIDVPNGGVDRYNKPHLIDPMWPGHDIVNFETLVPPSEIDLQIQQRIPLVQEGHECDDILLYMPNQADTNTLGGQLNSYLLAVMLATYTSKALVVLESGEDMVPGGSQFGCPAGGVDYTSKKKMERGRNRQRQKNNQQQQQQQEEEESLSSSSKKDFPKGLSRLIQYPEWLSRKCNVPCQNSHSYEKWSNVRKKNENSKFVQHTTCRNDSGWESRVLVVDGTDVQRYFDNNFKLKMLHRPSPTAYNWALRLGAKQYEAQTFANLEDENEIWDFIAALLARSDVLRFQPWIATDTQAFIRSSQLPMQVSYDAFYVRREEEEEKEGGGVEGYEKDANGVNNGIPFQDYLKAWERHDCSDKARIIYIASDEPAKIKEEISNFPVGTDGNLILPGVDECHGLRFYLREDSTSTAFMKKESASDCSIQYRLT